MTDYNIQVIVDPSRAKAGSTAVQQSLGEIESKADRTRSSIDRALSFSAVKMAQGNLDVLAASQNKAASSARQMAEAVLAMEVAERKSYQATRAQAEASRSASDALNRQASSVKSLDSYTGTYTANANKMAAATRELGQRSQLTQYQLTQLSFQLNDVVTGLLSGQAPMQIMAQQGGQVYQALSMGPNGLGGALRGLGGVVGSIFAKAGPFGLAALVLGTLGAAAFTAERDTTRLANALALTGNQVNLTAGTFDKMVNRVAEANNVTNGMARGTLMELVSSGKVAGGTIELMSSNIIKFAQFTGQTRQEVSTFMLSMGEDVSGWANKNLTNYGLISGAQLKHIQELQDMGRFAQAQYEAQSAMYINLGKIGPENLGFIERAWRGVKNSISDAWEALKEFGKAQGVADQLAEVRDQIKNGGSVATVGGLVTLGSTERAALKVREKALAAQLAADQQQQATVEENKRSAQAVQTHATEYAGLADNAGRAERALVKYRQTVKDMGRDAPSAAQQKAEEEALRKRYMPDAYRAEHKKGPTAPRDTSEERTAQIAQMVAQSKAEELQAQLQTTKEISDRAKISKDIIDLELEGKQAAIARQAANIKDDKGIDSTKEKLLLADLDKIKLTQERVAEDKKRAVDEIAADATIKENLSLKNSERDSNIAILKQQLDSARTIEDRNRIEHELLDKSDERLKAEADAVIASNNVTAAQQQIAENVKKTLDRTRADREKKIDQTSAIAKAEEMINELQLLDAVATRAGNAMADAFGRAGSALNNLVGALSNYRLQLESIHKAELENEKDPTRGLNRAQAERERLMLQVDTYGDLTSAAKSFFKENSKGYALMEAAERGWRLVQFALAIKAMFFQTAETTAAVANNATRTTVEVAGSTTRAAAKGSEGIAGIFAALGPFAFPVAAAAIAFMVAAGVKMGGGGSKSNVNVAQDRQDAQGTGSVLGDTKAKSESISRAIELAAQNSNKDLEYSNQMVRSLKNIESNIGVLAAAVARTLQIGGSLDTSGLNLGSTWKGSPLFGAIPLLGGLFGTKKTTTLQDQGLEFGPQSLADVLAGGVSGNSYQEIATQTKKKFFGLTYSNKTKVSTNAEALDEELGTQITNVIKSLREGVLTAAGTLGVEGAAAVLDAFTLDIGKISFKDMTGEEIQNTLNAVFGKVADDLSKAAVPMILELQKVGEGSFETLVRVTRNYQVLDTALQSIGKTFGAVGVSSLAAREDLIALVGGIDELVDKTAFFNENFLNDAERMAPIIKAVNAEFARLNIAGNTSKDQFKDLALAQDLTTESGREMYAALLNVAPAFAKILEYNQKIADSSSDLLNAANDNLDSARGTLIDAYNREASAIQGTIDKLKQSVEALKKYKESLFSGPAALLSPEGQYNAAAAAFRKTRVAALSGNQEAIGNLPDISQKFLDASLDYYAGTDGYFRDLEEVRSAVEAAESLAIKQLSVAEQSLEALTSQVGQLVELNKTATNVAQAIAAFLAARNQVTQLGGNPGNLPGTYLQNDQFPTQAGQAWNWYPGSPETNLNSLPQGFDAASYLSHNPDLLADYNNPNGRLGNLGFTSAEQAAAYHYAITGHLEIARGERGFARGGVFTNGVVSQPTKFTFGMMGEAGDEAIMPLTRTSRGLGVHVTSNDNGNQDMKAVLQELRRMSSILIATNELTADIGTGTVKEQKKTRQVMRAK